MNAPIIGPRRRGLTRDELVAAAREGLRTVPDGAAAVIALSGGPDSTALAYLVIEARPDLDATLAHVRHGLRDDTADLAVVHRHAAYLGLPLEVREVTVAPDGHGVAAAARDVRHAALRDVARARARGGAVVALGHTADDQAETVLLRAARGTGVTGLAAMGERRGHLVRPLLRVRRDDLATFVAEEGLVTASDPTNADPAARRVRVRRTVLPALATVGPDPVAALARLADLAAEDDAALEQLAAAVVREAVVTVGPVRSLTERALSGAPVAVRRRVLRRLVRDVGGGPPPSAADVAVVEVLTAGGRHRIGDVEVGRAGGWWTVAPAGAPVAPVARDLAVPGTTAWAAAGVRLVARTPQDDRVGDLPSDAQIAFALPGAWAPAAPAASDLAVPPGGRWERAHLLLPDTGPWRVRTRRDGDRVRTCVGTVRVVDAYADAGVPRAVRSRWPVVVDGDDRVVWVPGVAVDEQVRAAGRTVPAAQVAVVPSEPGATRRLRSAPHRTEPGRP